MSLLPLWTPCLPICSRNLPAPSELQDLRVLAAVAGEPDVALVIDGDAVIAVGPVVALPGTAPRLHQIAGLVVDEHRRRDLAALADRARRRSRLAGGGARLRLIVSAPGVADLDVGGLEVVFDGVRPMDRPDVVLRVDRQADRRAGHPVIRAAASARTDRLRRSAPVWRPRRAWRTDRGQRRPPR